MFSIVWEFRYYYIPRRRSRIISWGSFIMEKPERESGRERQRVMTMKFSASKWFPWGTELCVSAVWSELIKPTPLHWKKCMWRKCHRQYEVLTDREKGLNKLQRSQSRGCRGGAAWDGGYGCLGGLHTGCEWKKAKSIACSEQRPLGSVLIVALCGMSPFMPLLHH